MSDPLADLTDLLIREGEMGAVAICKYGAEMTLKDAAVTFFPQSRRDGHRGSHESADHSIESGTAGSLPASHERPRAGTCPPIQPVISGIGNVSSNGGIC